LKLKEKVAIVTGSSEGIGRGIALGLAQAGSDVVVNYNQSINKAEAAADEIRKLGRKSITIQADVSKSNDVHRMIQETLDAFGKIDVLVNNAGILIPGHMEELSEKDWDRVIDVNLKGVFLC